MMIYKDFYRRYGVRLLAHLSSPKSLPMALLELPKEAIYHYWGTGPRIYGPDANEFMFRNITRPIPVVHVTELGDHLGQPRKAQHPIEPTIRHYHTLNRRYRWARDPSKAMNDPLTPLVCNYSLVDQLVRYNRNIFLPFYRWWNVATRVISEMDMLANISDRQQFYVINAPAVLPTVSLLKRASAGMNQSLLKIFNTPEQWFLLEFWKWAGEDRKASLFSRIKDKNLSKINIIFTVAGKWTVVNLGVINDWRKDDIPKADDKGIEAKTFQRYAFRLMMSINNVKSSAGIDDSTEALAKQDIKTAAGKDNEPRLIATKQEPTPGKLVKEDIAVPAPAADESIPTDTKDTIKRDPKLEEELDKDIEAFEQMMASLSVEKNEPGTTVIEPSNIDDTVVVHDVLGLEEEYKTLDEGIKHACTELADAGKISAAEYRRYLTLSTAAESITGFDGKTPITEYAKVPPEIKTIPASPTFKDVATVPDKTMLKSSLEAFDSQYIKHAFHRDVSAMVLNIQNAAICVTDIKKERVENVMGSYDDFVVKVTPVEGANSTLRFKLPALDEDGTYQSNGIKYRMRKQRADLPIHKVAPDKVALTSYYGKTFVTRNPKRVNNYSAWLTNYIMAKGLDSEDQLITNLSPDNVFDNHTKVPRLFSMLAMNFRSFTVRDWNLYFDLRTKQELYDPAVIRQYERDGMVLVGRNGKGQYLVMDKNNAIYCGDQGQLKDLPPFEELLGMTAYYAPVDFTELKVLGKTIPLGVILGYRMGLENLMALFKIVPKRYALGSRVGMERNEFSVRFQDETLVFSREDRYAAMLFGGFNEYHNAIKDYSVFDFDKKSVYFNVLESAGMSARYLREIDLMFQLFVDPITKDLLKEMNEPTDFRGLLLRCNQLLLTDDHPDEFDSKYLRLRGYERMAGAVYSEISKAIRMHNGRTGKSKQPIDLNPYAIWNNIAKDPSISLVQDINPIENLKEQEAVTYSGVGGRSHRTMTKHTRIYHPSDMGVISEATKDSSDVGINTYTSADPQLTSIRGLSKPFDFKNPDPTSLFSTAALVSPAADRDDRMLSAISETI